MENGSCIVPGPLLVVPGPASTSFFIYVEGNSWSSGMGLRAETFGAALDHDAALDTSSRVDANSLGLAVCDRG